MGRLVPSPEDAQLIRQKQAQAVQAMRKYGIDVWLIFAREGTDSTLVSLLAGPEHIVQNAIFVLTVDGRRIALLEPMEIMNRAGQFFDEIIPYQNDISEPLRNLWKRLDPGRVALNYSQVHFAADGLTHGLYLRLQSALRGLGWDEHVVSAEDLVVSVRAVKAPEERQRLVRAAEITVRVAEEMTDIMRPGVTDTDLVTFVQRRASELGASRGFLTTRVNPVGQNVVGPIGRPVGAGEVVLADMGVVYKGYAADLKRLWYLKQKGMIVPSRLQAQWDACVFSLQAALETLRPGIPGFEVHERAWDALEARGYRRSRHSYGHQVGRDVHDAGPWLGDRANAYRPADGVLEPGMILTLDPTINTVDVVDPDWWCMGVEAEAEVTPDGGVPIHALQEQIWEVTF